MTVATHSLKILIYKTDNPVNGEYITFTSFYISKATPNTVSKDCHAKQPGRLGMKKLFDWLRTANRNKAQRIMEMN